MRLGLCSGGEGCKGSAGAQGVAGAQGCLQCRGGWGAGVSAVQGWLGHRGGRQARRKWPVFRECPGDSGGKKTNKSGAAPGTGHPGRGAQTAALALSTV